MMFGKNNKKQPMLKVRRNAGQSVNEAWERLMDDWLIPIVFGPAIFWAIWISHRTEAGLKHPLPAHFWLVAAIIATAIAALAYLVLLPKARALVRGERGERRVAELLDDLRRFGYFAFHDLCGQGYNIDHVVVGPAGVFAIETKFRSGYGEIEFRDGEGLFVGGRREEHDPLSQARKNAKDVNRLIKDNCGLYEWVKPLVVFVGDWKIKNRWRDTDARVLSTDQLVDYFDRLQPALKRREIELIASHLGRSVKS